MVGFRDGLIERLHREGALVADRFEVASHRANGLGEAPEEALIESGAMSEADLLRYLARAYQTRFVSTDRLAKADIDAGTLAMIPRSFAEQRGVFPVVFDGASQTLSVVTADAGDFELTQRVQVASNARAVQLFVARPAAVRAAISKFYGGDIHAFSRVDRQQIAQYRSMLDVFERNLLSEEALSAGIAPRKSDRGSDRGPSEGDRASVRGPGASGGSVALEDLSRAMTVMVSLLENNRGDLRGHSALVSRLALRVADRIGLPPVDREAIALAALLHDVGKLGPYHLTALNVAEYEGHRVAAQTGHIAPARLFEGVRMPELVGQCLSAMYERYEGGGLPAGATGKDIPLGARIIAIADTYADLTQNPRNPFRRNLTSAEACEALSRYAPRVFDPNIVDLFKHSVLGEDLRAKLLAGRRTVLVLDEDAEESTVLELRLLEAGHEVRAARSAEQALQALSRGGVDIVVSEVELRGTSGLDVLASVRGQSANARIPWMFVTRQPGRESVQRAFELGASDYVVKPTPTDVVVAKIQRSLDASQSQGSRGVSGSLGEMGFAELVQVLTQSRKTGVLKIRASSGDSGEVHFHEGTVSNALWAKLRGEEAFFGMCGLDGGDFVFDPSAKPHGRVITASPESLLLEGMRRMDESRL
jgi:response regulator RpfG family c-di-GMP phosphodiesterase